MRSFLEHLKQRTQQPSVSQNSRHFPLELLEQAFDAEQGSSFFSLARLSDLTLAKVRSTSQQQTGKAVLVAQ